PSWSDSKELAEVLRVDAPVLVDGDRRVRRADRLAEEEALRRLAALMDGVENTVLAVGIDDAVRVDRGCVESPLETVRVVDNAVDRAVGVSRTAARVRAREVPLGDERGAQLGDVVRTARQRRCSRVLDTSLGCGHALAITGTSLEPASSSNA